MSKRKNTRKKHFLEERKGFGNLLKNSNDCIKFNYKYFTSGNKYGQSFEEWEKGGILADLNQKLTSVSGKTKVELMQEGVLEIYLNGYPYDSLFEMPKTLKSLDLKWARIRLTGRRRLIGFFLPQYRYETEDGMLKDVDESVFYVVFLDKDHQFAPYKKKNT